MSTSTRLDLPPAFTVGQPRLLAQAPPPAVGRDRAWLIHAADQVSLLGRGGAAFPVATKLDVTPPGAAVVVNGSEGEPASHKDRVLMRHAPDLILDGVSLVARALHSERVVLAVSDPVAAGVLSSTAARRGNGFTVIHVDFGFVGGEVQALMNGLNGEHALPNGRRVVPSERGLDGRPTFASNVETFAQLALLAALGPAEYSVAGTTEEPGTSLVTVHGGPDGPRVIEAPNGTRLDRLLPGVTAGRAVLVGGYHGTWVDGRDLTVGRPAMRSHGATWGAGVVATLPDDTCPIAEIARVAQWLAASSAQQCGPCMFGLAAIADDLGWLARSSLGDGQGLLRRLGLVEGRGACHHPTGAVGFVRSGLRAFSEDFTRHLNGTGCGRPLRQVLPIGGFR